MTDYSEPFDPNYLERLDDQPEGLDEIYDTLSEEADSAAFKAFKSPIENGRYHAAAEILETLDTKFDLNLAEG